VGSVAWDLLRSDEATPADTSARVPSGAELAARAFYPLTLPLTVGPGSISVAITLAAQAPRGLRSFALMAAAGTLGALLLAATIYLLFRHAERLTRGLGATGTTVLLRLSAFILLCIGVQIVWSGVSALLGTLPIIRTS
jgi:multiple antibiotic resistance protein